MDTGKGVESPGFNINSFVNKLKNVDGRILGRDGLPLPRRNIQPNSELNKGSTGVSDGVEVPMNVNSVAGNGSTNSDVGTEHPLGSTSAEGLNAKASNVADKSSSLKESVQNEDGEKVAGFQSAMPSYASVVNEEATRRKVNFRLLESVQPSNGLADVQIPISEVVKANSRFENTLYGYFLGKRVAFLVVQQYVLNTWKKYGITNAMMNAKGFFFFKFNSVTGMEGVLENGPWFIRSIPIVLKKWSPNASLLKEDISYVPTWIKLHDVPIAAFTEDGLSVIASKLGTPIMLDSYTCTMCTTSWGRLDFARALIDLRADQPLRDSLVVAIPCVDGSDPTLHKVKVEYEWKPPRCDACKVFGHDDDHCPKKVEVNANQQGTRKVGTESNKQYDSQGFKQVPIKPFRGPVVGNQKKVKIGSTKQMYVPKKNKKETSTTPISNPFEILNLDHKVEGAASTSKQAAVSVNERAKEPSLYQKWQGTDGNDDDEDDVLDPFDYDMASYMESLDRSSRRKK